MAIQRAYFDYAAATPIDPRTIEVMLPYLSVNYGNPSGVHAEGIFARQGIEHARSDIAGILGVHADEIIFTGSATESANIALLGAVRAWQEVHPGRTAHTIVSAIEHDAVLVTAQALREMGVEVSIVPVNKEGVIDLELLASLIKKETVLISIMYANNEIGTIQPIKEIAKIIRRWKKEARGTVRSEKIDDESRYPLFHTDATQAVNYCDMHIPALGVDLLTMNGAKVYGPKGVGLLYVARHIKISAVSFGGGQEKGLRPGTENTAAIVGFAHALTLTRTLVSAESERLLRLRDELIALLTQQFDDIIINGSCLERLPNNVHFSFPDVDHEFLAIVLDREGFAVATKSACNELDAEISHVLLALREAAESTLPTSGIRLSFGRGTTLAEIERFVVTLKKIKETILIPV